MDWEDQQIKFNMRLINFISYQSLSKSKCYIKNNDNIISIHDRYYTSIYIYYELYD